VVIQLIRKIGGVRAYDDKMAKEGAKIFKTKETKGPLLPTLEMDGRL